MLPRMVNPTLVTTLSTTNNLLPYLSNNIRSSKLRRSLRRFRKLPNRKKRLRRTRQPIPATPTILKRAVTTTLGSTARLRTRINTAWLNRRSRLRLLRRTPPLQPPCTTELNLRRCRRPTTTVNSSNLNRRRPLNQHLTTTTSKLSSYRRSRFRIRPSSTTSKDKLKILTTATNSQP
uniref:(northern house mosquito) hypothetical protein n=1 Tax=Culex pipiens TaxID=7175 RepID=A0A8D8N5J5_CULPI